MIHESNHSNSSSLIDIESGWFEEETPGPKSEVRSPHEVQREYINRIINGCYQLKMQGSCKAESGLAGVINNPTRAPAFPIILSRSWLRDERITYKFRTYRNYRH